MIFLSIKNFICRSSDLHCNMTQGRLIVCRAGAPLESKTGRKHEKFTRWSRHQWHQRDTVWQLREIHWQLQAHREKTTGTGDVCSLKATLYFRLLQSLRFQTTRWVWFCLQIAVRIITVTNTETPEIISVLCSLSLSLALSLSTFGIILHLVDSLRQLLVETNPTLHLLLHFFNPFFATERLKIENLLVCNFCRQISNVTKASWQWIDIQKMCDQEECICCDAYWLYTRLDYQMGKMNNHSEAQDSQGTRKSRGSLCGD